MTIQSAPGDLRSLGGSAETSPDARRIVIAISVVAGIGLRWWGLGGVLSGDEASTGTYSQLPLGRILSFLADEDSHPPLDFLMRHFVAGAHDPFWLRAPSAAIGTATVLVVVWWMRDRGWFGTAMIVVTALSPFMILYARTARGYSIAIACGVVIAAAAERWLRRPTVAPALVMAGAQLVLMLTHSSGLLLLAGIACLPGLRRDRAAWIWRGALAGATSAWLALWGPAFVSQMGNQPGWIPYTTVTGLAVSLNGLLSPFYDAVTVSSLALVIGGGVILHRRDPVLARMVVCLFAIPVSAAAVAGIRSHVLLTRTLAPTVWAPLLCVAAVVEATRRWRQPGALVAVVALVALVLLPSLPPTLGFEEDTGRAAIQIAALSGPGDAVAINPAAIGHVLMWQFQAPIAGDRLGGIDTQQLWLWVRPGAAFSGRLWVLTFPGYRWTGDTGGRCPGRQSIETAEYTIRCFAVAVTTPR